MKALELSCKFCGEQTRPYRLKREDVEKLIANYVAHLVESHWDMLKMGRRQRLASGLPVNDAWTRL